MEELRAVARAFQGINGNFVIVGGVATALFDLHARADKATKVRTTYTQDIDVAVAGRVAVADDVVKTKFEEIGYRQELFPIASSPKALIKYVKEVNGTEFEVEFLVPLVGKEIDRLGRPKLVEEVADGIVAQQLRYLDILTASAEMVTLPGEEGLEISVPNPGNFLVHKFLTLHRRDRASDREKDAFYLFDILVRFADHHEYLAQEVIRVCKEFKPAKHFPRDMRAFFETESSEGIVLLMAEYRRSYAGKFPLMAPQALAFVRGFLELLPE